MAIFQKVVYYVLQTYKFYKLYTVVQHLPHLKNLHRRRPKHQLFSIYTFQYVQDAL